jgi:hypothetical protein
MDRLFDEPARPLSIAERGFADKRGLVQQKRSTDTQRAAAALVLPKSGTMRRLVYDTIRTAPDGMTDSEIAAATGLSYNSFGPRRRELLTDALVQDSGQRRPSLEPPHRQQIVWTQNEKGSAT